MTWSAVIIEPGRFTRCFVSTVIAAAVAVVLPSGVSAAPIEPFVPPVPPSLSSRAAYVYDASAKTPLFALEPDRPLAPASLTKLMTALVVVEQADLGEMVTIEPQEVVDDSQSRVDLLAGDTLSVADLLTGLLVPSGNDAALALARHVGSRLGEGEADPIAAFVAEMNRRAAALGLTATTFANPTGLDDERQRASARDLALLTAALLEYPQIADALGTSATTLPSTLKPDGYAIVTTNDLLVDGLVTGGKTGTTLQAGGCLMTVSEMAGNTIITVVLGAEVVTDENGNLRSPARFDDTRSLLAELPEAYAWVDPEREVISGLAAELAAWEAELGPGTGVPVPAARLGDFTYRLVLGPPAAPGGEVGKVLFLVGPELLTERPLVQAAPSVAVAEIAA